MDDGPRRDTDWDEQVRHETGLQRLDRNWLELLQELRVAQTGVQVLLAFLLTLPFQQRFSTVTTLQRDSYLVTLLLAATASAMLIGPVAYHRAVFRQHAKDRLVATASRMAVGGLVLLALAIVGAVFLVADFLLRPWGAGLITGGIGLLFGWLWLVVPLLGRRAADREERAAPQRTPGGG